MFFLKCTEFKVKVQKSKVNEQQDDLRRPTVGLSIVQDVVYVAHGGHKWTPTHVKLASSLYQATRSKLLDNLFHKAGHCLSYKQVLQLVTMLEESTLQTLDEDSGPTMRSFITQLTI